MKHQLSVKLFDIETDQKGFGKPKFVLNTVKHDKPIVAKLILDSEGRWRPKTELIDCLL